jgi:hypothetical protein
VREANALPQLTALLGHEDDESAFLAVRAITRCMGTVSASFTWRGDSLTLRLGCEQQRAVSRGRARSGRSRAVCPHAGGPCCCGTAARVGAHAIRQGGSAAGDTGGSSRGGSGDSGHWGAGGADGSAALCCRTSQHSAADRLDHQGTFLFCPFIWWACAFAAAFVSWNACGDLAQRGGGGQAVTRLFSSALASRSPEQLVANHSTILFLSWI